MYYGKAKTQAISFWNHNKIKKIKFFAHKNYKKFFFLFDDDDKQKSPFITQGNAVVLCVRHKIFTVSPKKKNLYRGWERAWQAHDEKQKAQIAFYSTKKKKMRTMNITINPIEIE